MLIAGSHTDADHNGAVPQIRVDHECDFERPEMWEPGHRWAVDMLDRFDRVFRPRVKVLRAEGDEA
jgi:hypothetical protein